MKNFLKFQSGFSLLEFSFVLFCFFTVMLFSLPYYHKLIAKITLEQSLWCWEVHIREARLDAIKTQQAVMFCPAVENQWHHAVVLRSSLGVIKKFSALGEDYTIQWHGFPIQQPCLVFQANGLLENENGHFDFCFKQACKKIMIAKSGRMRSD